MESDDKKSQANIEEPRAGEGVRSLATWQRLAEARRALQNEPDAREQLASNPAAYFQRFGVDNTAAGERSNLSDLERQLAVSANAAPELAIQADARRAWLVLPNVNVVVNANALLNANANANANLNANLNGNANANANANANLNLNANANGNLNANANASYNANWQANWNWSAGVD